MTTYAIAHLRDVHRGAGIRQYLESIDATLAPFDGRFVVHGDRPTMLEGAFDAAIVVIGFPDRARADGWYRSAAYQEILPLRTGNSTGDAFLVDGVEADHVATDVLADAQDAR